MGTTTHHTVVIAACRRHDGLDIRRNFTVRYTNKTASKSRNRFESSKALVRYASQVEHAVQKYTPHVKGSITYCKTFEKRYGIYNLHKHVQSLLHRATDGRITRNQTLKLSCVGRPFRRRNTNSADWTISAAHHSSGDEHTQQPSVRGDARILDTILQLRTNFQRAR